MCFLICSFSCLSCFEQNIVLFPRFVQKLFHVFACTLQNWKNSQCSAKFSINCHQSYFPAFGAPMHAMSRPTQSHLDTRKISRKQTF